MADVGLVLFGCLIRAPEGIYILFNALFNAMTNVRPVGEASLHLSSFFYVAIYSRTLRLRRKFSLLYLKNEELRDFFL